MARIWWVKCGARARVKNIQRGTLMSRIAYMLIGVLVLAGAGAKLGFAPALAGGKRDAVLGGKLPEGYRDWRLISVAHEEGNLNDLRAVLGNDIAINAYRKGLLPFPDGAMIARLAWKYVPSEENNLVFGQSQSFVAGIATNVQFMVKDSTKYASTGGWGFAQFNEGHPIDEKTLSGCFGCHVPVKARDYIFTKYTP
jgi:hypothetical protein